MRDIYPEILARRAKIARKKQRKEALLTGIEAIIAVIFFWAFTVMVFCL